MQWKQMDWPVLVDSLNLLPPPSGTAVSQETRRVELELRSPLDAPAGRVTIPAYALYYVCEDVGHVPVNTAAMKGTMPVFMVMLLLFTY